MKLITETYISRIGLCLGAMGLSLLLCEGLLAVLKYPTEVQPRVAHPANFQETRRSTEFKYTFKTNDRGLRYHVLPLEKPSGTHRVFVCGDSFVEGTGIEEGERFTDLLEGRFCDSSNGVFFINGGLAGTGPLEYGRVFLGVGLGYHPDGLLICIYANDIANTVAVLDPRAFDAPPPRSGMRRVVHGICPRLYTMLKSVQFQRGYKHETQTTDFLMTIEERARQQGISEEKIDAWKASVSPELVAAVNRGEFNGAGLSTSLLYPSYWTDSIDLDSETANVKWSGMTLHLGGIFLRAKPLGIEVAMVLIPANFQYTPGRGANTRWLTEDSELQKRLKQWAYAQNVPFLDLTPVCRKAVQEGQRLDYPQDGHWTSAGHALAAKSIGDWLIGQRVFSFMTNSEPNTLTNM